VRRDKQSSSAFILILLFVNVTAPLDFHIHTSTLELQLRSKLVIGINTHVDERKYTRGYRDDVRDGGTGHLSMLESPGEISSLISEFCKVLAASGA
jgi:hypothetical protein